MMFTATFAGDSLCNKMHVHAVNACNCSYMSPTVLRTSHDYDQWSPNFLESNGQALVILHAIISLS